MRNNNEILSEITAKLDSIRKLDNSIKQKQGVIAMLNGNTQSNPVISIGSERVEIANWNRRYTYEVKPEYQTAVVFLKRGLANEIDVIKSEIENIKRELAGINLSEIAEKEIKGI